MLRCLLPDPVKIFECFFSVRIAAFVKTFVLIRKLVPAAGDIDVELGNFCRIECPQEHPVFKDKDEPTVPAHHCASVKTDRIPSSLLTVYISLARCFKRI